MNLSNEKESTNIEIRNTPSVSSSSFGIKSLLGSITIRRSRLTFLIILLGLLVLFSGYVFGSENVNIPKLLGSTERVWSSVFTSEGRKYTYPKLVIYNTSTSSKCGTINASGGPVYCSGDQNIYVDLTFYDFLHNQLRSPGDFAQAYIIAHEVGHHVQYLKGQFNLLTQLKSKNPKMSVWYDSRLELQADCYAGVWAKLADTSANILESGDIDEGLKAASEIGDDILQRRFTGVVKPDTFGHGTSDQRKYWLSVGITSGDYKACDTFSITVP